MNEHFCMNIECVIAFLCFLLGSKTFPKDSRNGRGRKQSSICIDR